MEGGVFGELLATKDWNWLKAGITTDSKVHRLNPLEASEKKENEFQEENSVLQWGPYNLTYG